MAFIGPLLPGQTPPSSKAARNLPIFQTTKTFNKVQKPKQLAAISNTQTPLSSLVFIDKKGKGAYIGKAIEAAQRFSSEDVIKYYNSENFSDLKISALSSFTEGDSLSLLKNSGGSLSRREIASGSFKYALKELFDNKRLETSLSIYQGEAHLGRRDLETDQLEYYGIAHKDPETGDVYPDALIIQSKYRPQSSANVLNDSRYLVVFKKTVNKQGETIINPSAIAIVPRNTAPKSDIEVHHAKNSSISSKTFGALFRFLEETQRERSKNWSQAHKIANELCKTDTHSAAFFGLEEYKAFKHASNLANMTKTFTISEIRFDLKRSQELFKNFTVLENSLKKEGLDLCAGKIQVGEEEIKCFGSGISAYDWYENLFFYPDHLIFTRENGDRIYVKYKEDKKDHLRTKIDYMFIKRKDSNTEEDLTIFNDGDLKTSRKHFEIIDWLQSSFESYTAAALRGLDAYSNSSYMN